MIDLSITDITLILGSLFQVIFNTATFVVIFKTPNYLQKTTNIFVLFLVCENTIALLTYILVFIPFLFNNNCAFLGFVQHLFEKLVDYSLILIAIRSTYSLYRVRRYMQPLNSSKPFRTALKWVAPFYIIQLTISIGLLVNGEYGLTADGGWCFFTDPKDVVKFAYSVVWIVFFTSLICLFLSYREIRSMIQHIDMHMGEDHHKVTGRLLRNSRVTLQLLSVWLIPSFSYRFAQSRGFESPTWLQVVWCAFTTCFSSLINIALVFTPETMLQYKSRPRGKASKKQDPDSFWKKGQRNAMLSGRHTI
eukprot:gnl/Dysnectes_brevis/10476_a20787_153.p1 GENE.gnl/Dysnectes_brevis/10476_a20787_153~~gnl/Dysnectes_brevis/10476_a20787_153.p1  ORF type:complete len:306 (+),score=-8.75 gnl/Dysnectes_brevis/10476_a20787_153:102-1019(+)